MDRSVYLTTDTNELADLAVEGFFVGWPTKPSETQLRESILGADKAILAIDGSAKCLVGYITAITDHALCAYLPFLEVLPTYQSQGLGKALMERMLSELGDLYMTDLVCDKEVAGFYKKAGFESWHAMIRRNPNSLKGAPLGE